MMWKIPRNNLQLAVVDSLSDLCCRHTLRFIYILTFEKQIVLFQINDRLLDGTSNRWILLGGHQLNWNVLRPQ